MKLDEQEIHVLRTIRRHASISRKALASELGLSQASITNITRSLMEQQYILEGEHVGERRGRKEILLHVNPAKFRYLGIDIGMYLLRFAISDNHLNITHYKEFLTEEFKAKPDALTEIMERMDAFLAESGLEAQHIDAVGIGVTGIVSKDRQSIVSVPNATHWGELGIVAAVHQRLQCPVFLDESGRVMALVEKVFGQARPFSDFIIVHVSHSVVAGFMTNGAILRGYTNIGGLLGHITVDESAGRCLCGNYGCLEDQVVLPMAKLKYRKKSGEDSNKLFEAVRKNDKTAIDVCMEVGKAIGIALSNVVNLFNPQAIFIGGAVFEHLPFVLDETKRTILLRANRYATVELQMLQSSYADKQGLKGALALASTELLA
ncbi:MAG: family transcriptional regulator [Paenibacillus sp.]|jgi:N-acetylglucosamine repressor|nr:family transcriptional regulator [Paenibacillus sp.]